MEADIIRGLETGRAAGAVVAHDSQTVEKDRETRIRRLTLDNDDLRIECQRLRSLLLASEAEVLALRDYTRRLQADLSVEHSGAPFRILRRARRLWLQLRHR